MFLIALTGYHVPDERPGHRGFNAHLIKPLCIDALFDPLERVEAEKSSSG